MAHRGNGKPRVHARDHEHGGADPTLIVYEDVGDPGGGGGSGIQFDVTPQEGGYLEVTTTTGTISFETTGGDDINLVSSESVNLTADVGINLVSDGSGGIQLNTSSGSGGDIVIEALTSSGSNIILRIHSGSLLQFVGLPTSSPGVSGAVWNNGGVLNIS